MVKDMEVSKQVSLIRASQYDSDQLAALSKLAFDTDSDYCSTISGGPPGYDDPEWQKKIMKTNDYYCILFNDSIVGGVIVGDAGGDHKVLERIYVDPKYHRRGIGSRAMVLTIETYPEVKVWTLGTPDWNTRTKNFYEKLGFIQIGIDKSDLNNIGRWYQKIIDDSWSVRKVETLRDGSGNVTVEGEILEKAHARQVRNRRRYGETLSVADSGFGDETGRLVLTLWNNQIKTIQVGDRIRVENGYVGSYGGIKQLSVGRAGRIIHLL